MRLSPNHLVTVAAATLMLAVALSASAHAATLPATPATFGTVVAQAKGGDTIALAPGAYSLVLSGKSFDPPLTIAGPGVFAKVDLRGVSGLTLSSVELAGPSGVIPGPDGKPVRLYPFFWDGVARVRIEDAKIHTEPVNALAGLRIQNSSAVTVSRVEHWGSQDAISWANLRDFEVSASNFHDLQSDGVKGAGGTGVRIVGNRFTRFKPLPGDHPDAIQFWSVGVGPSSDVLIQGNQYFRGPGGPETAAQGVFVNGGGAAARMANVRIKDNVIAGGMYNSIMAVGVDGLEITGNTVAGFPDQQAFIRWSDDTGLTMTGNRAQLYVTPGAAYGAVPAGNEALAVVKDGGAALQAAVTVADPREAIIAALKAQVSDLTGKISTLQAQGASLAADLASARATVTDLTGKLSAVSAANDNARAALAGVRDQATAALAR